MSSMSCQDILVSDYLVCEAQDSRSPEDGSRADERRLGKVIGGARATKLLLSAHSVVKAWHKKGDPATTLRQLTTRFAIKLDLQRREKRSDSLPFENSEHRVCTHVLHSLPSKFDGVMINSA